MSEHDLEPEGETCQPDCPLCANDRELDEHMAECAICNETDASCARYDALIKEQQQIIALLGKDE